MSRAESDGDRGPRWISQRIPRTRPAMTRPQNTSIISIITTPPAPHAHHIGCMPHSRSYDRSCANAANGVSHAGARATKATAAFARLALRFRLLIGIPSVLRDQRIGIRGYPFADDLTAGRGVVA